MAKSFWQTLLRALGIPRLDENQAPPDDLEALKQLESDINARTNSSNIKIVRGSGSIGDKSAQLGYDWRDLKMSGYSDNQINGVLQGKYTLDELFKMKPDGKPQ